MSAITKLILVNLIIVIVSLLILYPIYLYFFKEKPNNYIGMVLIFGFIILRPRARIVQTKSKEKVQIKWFGKIWEI